MWRLRSLYRLAGRVLPLWPRLRDLRRKPPSEQRPPTPVSLRTRLRRKTPSEAIVVARAVSSSSSGTGVAGIHDWDLVLGKTIRCKKCWAARRLDGAQAGVRMMTACPGKPPMVDKICPSHLVSYGESEGLVLPVCVACGGYGKLTALLRSPCQKLIATKRRYCMRRIARGLHPNGAFARRVFGWIDKPVW